MSVFFTFGFICGAAFVSLLVIGYALYDWHYVIANRYDEEIPR